MPTAITALAGPIANGMKGFVNDQVNKVLSTPQFQQFWVNATRRAQQQVVAVLNGDSKAIQTVNGQVVLNLVPLLNQVLANMSGTLSSLLGRNITLPTISGNELPSVVCEKISTALGRPLPATCGQIPLFPADKLTTAQDYVTRFNRWFVGLLILTPLLVIGAIWLSRRHRRTALQIAVGGVLGLVVVRRLTMYLEGRLTGAAKNQAAAEAVISQVLHLFFNLTLLLGIIGLVCAALLLITGPYRWARATRSGVRRGCCRDRQSDGRRQPVSGRQGTRRRHARVDPGAQGAAADRRRRRRGRAAPAREPQPALTADHWHPARRVPVRPIPCRPHRGAAGGPAAALCAGFASLSEPFPAAPPSPRSG